MLVFISLLSLCLGDLCLYYLQLILERLIVFALFLIIIIIIKSPKQGLGDLLFLLRFLLLFLFFFFYSFSFLSADHELVHGRSQELLDRISWNFVEL